MPYTTERFVLGPDDAGRRLDRILRALLSDLPLSSVYRLIRDGEARIGGKRVDGSYRTEAGDVLTVKLPAALPPRQQDAAPSGDLAETGLARLFSDLILRESADIAVINKPRGMLTHGPGGVDEAAKAYFASRAAASIAFTPAPLHRLDRNTSGALAVSASIAGAVAFSAALRGGLVGKAYLALLGGALKTEESWIDALSRDGESGSTRVAPDGKRAIASAAPLMTRGGATLAYIRLGTGRTHQIRAQAASRGLPLLGDLKYGGSRFQRGYILHCLSLSVPPGAGVEGGATIEAPLPEPALASLRSLFGPGFYDEMLEAIAALTPGQASAPAL